MTAHFCLEATGLPFPCPPTAPVVVQQAERLRRPVPAWWRNPFVQLVDDRSAVPAPGAGEAGRGPAQLGALPGLLPHLWRRPAGHLVRHHVGCGQPQRAQRGGATRRSVSQRRQPPALARSIPPPHPAHCLRPLARRQPRRRGAAPQRRPVPPLLPPAFELLPRPLRCAPSLLQPAGTCGGRAACWAGRNSRQMCRCCSTASAATEGAAASRSTASAAGAKRGAPPRPSLASPQQGTHFSSVPSPISPAHATCACHRSLQPLTAPCSYRPVLIMQSIFTPE